MTLPEFSTKLATLNIPWVVTSTCVYCPKYQKHGEGHCFYPSINWWIDGKNLSLEDLFLAIEYTDKKSKLITEEGVVEIEYIPNHTIKLKCLK